MKSNTQTGFTLYELMITLLIVGVVLSYGVPNMAEFRQNSRMTTTANDLHTTFHQARSEAARAKSNVTICASADSAAAVPVCGGEFEAGWVMFEDIDGNIAVGANEPVIRRFDATPFGVVINTGGVAMDYFSYAPTGIGRGNVGPNAAVGVMVMCDDRGNETAAGGSSAARVLVVTPLGRAMVLREEDQVAFHGGC